MKGFASIYTSIMEQNDKCDIWEINNINVIISSVCHLKSRPSISVKKKDTFRYHSALPIRRLLSNGQVEVSHSNRRSNLIRFNW